MSRGSSSSQRASTAFDLEKKRWPPMSNRNPRHSSVREIPPTRDSCASSTTTRAPVLARRYAAVSPAGPAPTTATSGASVMLEDPISRHVVNLPVSPEPSAKRRIPLQNRQHVQPLLRIGARERRPLNQQHRAPEPRDVVHEVRHVPAFD